MFSCHSSGKGIVQSNRPPFASRPMIERFVSVTICELAPTVMSDGDA